MKERRAIYTVVVGEKTRRVAELTLPRMRQYAKRCGAELVVFEKDTLDGPYFSKYDALIEACERGFDRVLYLDADIVVFDDQEDIFYAYDCGLQNEYDVPDGVSTQILDIAVTEIRRNFAPDFQAPYYNTGVILLDRATLEPLADRLRDMERIRLILWEQCQLNWHLRELGAPDVDLPAKWNYQFGWTQRDGRTVLPDELRFFHFCGNQLDKRAEIATFLAGLD